MAPTAAQHRLTEAEREAFERDGFVMLRDTLTAEATRALSEIAKRYDTEFHDAADVNGYALLNLHDLVGRDVAFLELVDCPTPLPKPRGVLGWNIQLFHPARGHATQPPRCPAGWVRLAPTG